MRICALRRKRSYVGIISIVIKFVSKYILKIISIIIINIKTIVY